MSNWFSIGSSALGLLGGIGSAAASNAAAKRNLEAQRQENEKNRIFNAEQARLAREYNTRMVAEQRQYDDPSSVMQRLKTAGIHPALAYSNGMPMMDFGVGSTGMAAASNSGVSPSMPDYSSLGSLGTNLGSTLESVASAREKNTVSNLNDIELKYRDDFLSRQNVRLSCGIKLDNETLRLTKNEADDAAKRVAYTEELTNAARRANSLAHAQEQLVGIEIDMAKLDKKMKEELYEYEKEYKLASYDITIEESYYAGQFFAARADYEENKSKEAEYAYKESKALYEARCPHYKNIFGAEADKILWDRDHLSEEQWYSRIGTVLDVVDAGMSIYTAIKTAPIPALPPNSSTTVTRHRSSNGSYREYRDTRYSR